MPFVMSWVVFLYMIGLIYSCLIGTNWTACCTQFTLNYIFLLGRNLIAFPDDLSIPISISWILSNESSVFPRTEKARVLQSVCLRVSEVYSIGYRSTKDMEISAPRDHMQEDEQWIWNSNISRDMAATLWKHVLQVSFTLDSWVSHSSLNRGWIRKSRTISLLSAQLLESSLHSSPRTFQLNAQVPYFWSSEHPKKLLAKLSHALLRFSSMIPKIILAFLALLVKSEHDRPYKQDSTWSTTSIHTELL